MLPAGAGPRQRALEGLEGDDALGADGQRHDIKAIRVWNRHEPGAGPELAARLAPALRPAAAAFGRDGCETRRIAAADYDTIFRTRHGVDLVQLQGLAGIDVTVVDESDDLPAVLQAASVKTEPGVDLVIVRIDPDHDMAVRRSITTAVGEAING